MRAVRFFVLLILNVWLCCGPAHAEKRVALVVGNSAYKNVPRLPNTARDAALIASMLKDAAFDVVTGLDLDVSGMRKALRDFAARARDADIAIVYYAGHGIEMDGNNYLIPTDAVLQTDGDVLDEAISLDRVLFAVEPVKRLRLIILDACRDNPFAKTMKRTVASRGIGRGLAKVEPNTPNTMIAFAAKAGSTASDGDSENGPFAKAIVNRLPQPGLDLRMAFGYVRDEVLKNTGYQQEPYVYGSLGGDKVSLVPAKPADVGPAANPQDAVRRDYELALQLGTRDGWTAFLAQYADGFYANLAKGQLNKIAAEEARAAASEKARKAENEKARLAADGAKKAEQNKAAATAKAAEDARLAAEKARELEEAKAVAAEQRRKEAEAVVAKALTEKQAGQKQGGSETDQKVAALPSPTPSPEPVLSPQDLAKSVQSELRRVGCLGDVENGGWSATSQRSLTSFNKYAGTRLDTGAASLDALEAIKARRGRVCPLVCDHGFSADGDSCVKIACLKGYRVNDDNECEKIQEKKPVATRDDAAKRDAERQKVESAPASKPQASGQVFCNQAGCRPVRSGCRLETTNAQAVGMSSGRLVEVCN